MSVEAPSCGRSVCIGCFASRAAFPCRRRPRVYFSPFLLATDLPSNRSRTHRT